MYSSQEQRFCIISILCLVNLALCWKIVLERPEVVYLNREILECNASIKRITRNTVAMNMSFHVLQEFPSNARLHVDMFGFYTNAYRRLAVNIKRNLCSTFDFEYKLIKDDIKGHIPDKCPVKKGDYYLRNFVPNTQYFPPSPWSASQYYIELTFLFEEIVEFQYRIYIRLERNPLEIR